MPELPEVETVRRDLEAELVGRRITRVEATGVRTFRRQPDMAAFEARTLGRSLVGVGRRGKYLLLRLNGPDAVVVHLRMSGQLLATPPDAPLARHTHAVLSFDAGKELRFVDPRTFGEVFVSTAVPFTGGAVLTGAEGAPKRAKSLAAAVPSAPGTALEPTALEPTALEPTALDPSTLPAGEVVWTVPELANLGVEPLDPRLEPDVFGRLLRSRRRALKALLLDQSVVAGIGNIYADELLWRARLRPSHRSDRLSGPAIRRLHESMVDTLCEAIEYRGSTLADEQYRDLYGQAGSYQRLHRVHGRVAQPCPRCGEPIRRVQMAGRTTYFCRHCQR
jgi:formamidopyrimidine-DNA glycosylase